MYKQINIDTYSSIITSIAVSAASQVDGIASVTYEPGLITNNSSRRKRSAVEVIIFDNLVTINISVNVYYGKVIPVVVCNLQEKIKKEVEASTSLTVKTVNVNVVGSVNI
ncbi:MAG: Asp23/Gls24 family envelope stress response protein [Christensenella sp.]|nr:Asp23/Gls24 family envelope stress response protein [Christensenella sp.]